MSLFASRDLAPAPGGAGGTARWNRTPRRTRSVLTRKNVPSPTPLTRCTGAGALRVWAGDSCRRRKGSGQLYRRRAVILPARLSLGGLRWAPARWQGADTTRRGALIALSWRWASALAHSLLFRRFYAGEQEPASPSPWVGGAWPSGWELFLLGPPPDELPVHGASW